MVAARTWDQYGEDAIRLLYPTTRSGVHYAWGKTAPGAAQSLLVDNSGIPMRPTDIQTWATYLMGKDPNNDYTPAGGTTPTPPTPMPAFPGPTDVGYKASMGALVGSVASLTTTAPGQIIELVQFAVGHYVRINHPNCIVRKCVFLSGDFYDIRIATSVTTGTTTIEDCSFDNSAVGAGQGGGTAIMGSRMLVQRCSIIKMENGIALDGSDVTIKNNYIGSLAAAQPGDLHTDGIQIDGGISNVTIAGNTIACPTDGTSAVMIDNLNGACANIAVNNNKLSGGSYTVYSDGSKSGSAMTNIAFTNNVFALPNGVNGAGSISGQGAAGVTWTGNTREADGSPVPKP